MALAHNFGAFTIQIHLKQHRYVPFKRLDAVRSILGRGVRRLCAAPSPQMHTPFTVNKELDGSCTEDTIIKSHDAHSAYCVVNFYHLTKIPNPLEVVEKHRSWMNGRDIKGRIYLSSQGINAQYTGAWDDAVAYPKWLEEQSLFQGLHWMHKPSAHHLFPKLRLQFKPNLVQLKGGMSELPITDKSARATPLKPTEWKEMLMSAREVTHKYKNDPIVLDVRNSYEWDAGHFDGVERPTEDSFCQTPVGSSGGDIPKALIGRSPDTPVMMYCTGGIRCDVYSTFLRKKGFHNLYSLEGGVQNYFEEEGGQNWTGSLFVFDERLAISPSESTGSKLPAAVKCEVCGAADGDVPHRNCANIDCNKLFITCGSCRNKFHGCCCEDCISAPRLLRPISDGQYQKWGQYTDGSRQSRTRHLEDTTVVNSGASSRQKRRRKVSKKKQTKRDALRSIKQRRKQLAKEVTQNRVQNGAKSLQQNLAALGEGL